MKKRVIFASALVLTLTGCGIDKWDLDGSQESKFWAVTNMNPAASKAAYHEWCVKEGINSDVAVTFIQNKINNPQLVKQWGEAFYNEQTQINNGNSNQKYNTISEIITAKQNDIIRFIRDDVTVQQYKEIIPVLKTASNNSQDFNTNNNVVLIAANMSKYHLSAQEAFDKVIARGVSKKSYVEVTPQRKEEIRRILQYSSYNTQQQLKPYLDGSLQLVSNYMDQNNLSAQDAINKIMADRDQEAIQSRLKEWGSAAAKKCNNKILDLQGTWTNDEGFVSGTCYTITANIFQRLSSNKVLSKIIVFSDYQFKLIYIMGGKSISDGEALLVVPIKNFRYKNIVGYNKEINGFRVIQQQ